VSVPVAVANIGALCTMHYGLVICPDPFPSRLVTTHTSSATAIVNNTMFARRDAIVVTIGRTTDRYDDRLVQ